MMPAKNPSLIITSRSELIQRVNCSGDYFCDVNKYANGEKDARIIYDATNATRATQAEFRRFNSAGEFQFLFRSNFIAK
jgi:hypothetical protein